MTYSALRRVSIGASLAVAVTTLSGCGMLDWGSRFAPTPSPVVTPTTAASATPKESPSPTPEQTQPPTPSAVAVPATGTMMFYANPVSEALSGTCQGSDVLTVSLSDPKNDFYDGVDVDVQIDTVTKVATSVVMDLGQDAESGTHQLTFSATASSPGTRVKVVVSGASYSLTGVLQDLEDRHGKKTTSLIPFSLTVVCSA